MSEARAFLCGFLSVFDWEFDPTLKQSMPTPFSGELERRLLRRRYDLKSRTLLPVWEGVGKALQSAMSEYERTNSLDEGSQGRNESRDSATK